MITIPLRVSDYMTRDLATISPDTELAQAVRLMLERDVSGLIVTDADGRVAGVITERDCIKAAAEAGYYEEWGGPVSKYMSAAVETVGPDDSLIDVAAKMAVSRHRRYPVVADGRLVGLLSRRDVLRAIETGSWPTRFA